MNGAGKGDANAEALETAMSENASIHVAQDSASTEWKVPTIEGGIVVSSFPDLDGHSFRFADAQQQIHHRKWLLDGILPSGGINLLFGAPGCGKSFLALDMAICVSSGQEWHGHKVERKPVLYFAGEGHRAEYHNRIYAACRRYGFPEGTPDLQADLVIKRMDMFGEAEDRQLMGKYVERITNRYLSPPGLIIIDTLAACTPSMDEIRGSDVGKMLVHFNNLAEQSNAAILLIHHSGATGVRERGHTSLAGECASILRVDKGKMTLCALLRINAATLCVTTASILSR